MLRLGFFFLLLLLPASFLSAAGLEVVHVSTQWRDAASFQRISEYFNGRENTGGIIVLRTQPGERAGHYWQVRLKNPGAPVAGAKFELQVISSAAPGPKTFAFAADVPAGSRLYQLGLTGTDWPDTKARPVAWQLRVLAADGQTLLVKKSFLWELPEG